MTFVSRLCVGNDARELDPIIAFAGASAYAARSCVSHVRQALVRAFVKPSAVFESQRTYDLGEDISLTRFEGQPPWNQPLITRRS